jgi:hypothetical protein
MKEFRENADGVHLMYGEFTLCGDSFDIADTEEGFEEGPLVKTRKRTVTCPKCVAHILHCRGVRIETTSAHSRPEQRGGE